MSTTSVSTLALRPMVIWALPGDFMAVQRLPGAVFLPFDDHRVRIRMRLPTLAVALMGRRAVRVTSGAPDRLRLSGQTE